MQALQLHVDVRLTLGARRGGRAAAVTLTLDDHLPPLPGPRRDGTATADPPGDDVATIPTDDRNLAVRAALLLLQHSGAAADHGVDIRLVKRIPSGGGLAGGSSDAGAVLTGLNTLLGDPVSPAELAGLAAQLGSDVPFFLVGGTALCTGRGEIVEPLTGPRAFQVELILPPWRLPTPRVYMALAAPPATPIDPGLLAHLRASLADADVATLEFLYRNDLEPAACRVAPATSRWLDEGLHLSGSGSTFFRFGEPSAAGPAPAPGQPRLPPGLLRRGDPAPAFFPTRSRNR